MRQSETVQSQVSASAAGAPAAEWIGADDLYLFNEGNHCRAHRFLGAHPGEYRGESGTWFAVWAPGARRVSVLGDFNRWTGHDAELAPVQASGIWAGFVPGVERGALYKYRIESRDHPYTVDKADPVGFWHEVPPRTASVVWDLGHEWRDQEWMGERHRRHRLGAPMAIYEVHLGSFRRVPAEGNRPLGYREIAAPLAEHVEKLGFTHVELMPVMEHPFYGSWGYQVTGYFAPTSRYGTPQDLMYLIDYLHQRGIGVILDWVPAHFPSDEYGLAFFDGTHLYEHADPRRGFHPDWKSAIFNYGRNEVRSFLLSSAHFWLEQFHADGLRVDGVASMLYLDYSRCEGEWLPNQHGGRENLEAVAFLRQLNESIYRDFPDVQVIAEESTAWPLVSRPTYVGGLGFGLKWDMGWMHDTLRYFGRDPVHRKYHHGDLTFRSVYAFHENFVLPLSHDEVVHGKGSLIGRMPGDDWQKLAQLRLLLAHQFATPGKKLLFMGGELGQWREWDHDGSIDWHLLEQERHRGVMALVGHLGRTYRAVPALHELDCEPGGFEWIDASDAEQSVLSFARRDRAGGLVVVVCNFTPVLRTDYRLGVPYPGTYREIVNTDAHEYGGSGAGNLGRAVTRAEPCHGRTVSLSLTVPPLAALFLQLDR
jgi:1,4-alpha-glucan branching enzyme